MKFAVYHSTSICERARINTALFHFQQFRNVSRFSTMQNSPRTTPVIASNIKLLYVFVERYAFYVCRKSSIHFLSQDVYKRKTITNYEGRSGTSGNRCYGLLYLLSSLSFRKLRYLSSYVAQSYVDTMKNGDLTNRATRLLAVETYVLHVL